MATVLFVIILFMFLLFIALKLSHFLFSPQVCYIAGFLVQAVFCAFYAGMWGTVLEIETILIIVGGATWFLIVCQLISRRKGKILKEQVTYSISIEKWKLFLFLLIQILTLVLLLQFYRNTFGGGSLGEAIYRFRSIIQGNIDEDIVLPSIVATLRGVSCAIGYMCSYVLTYNIINKNKKNLWIYIANVVLSLVNEGMLGARGGIITFLLGMVMEIAIIAFKEYNKKVNFSQIFRVLLLGLALLITFPIVGELMGRPGLGLLSYELAVYLGAPLHNFNSYISNIESVKSIGFSTIYTLLVDLESIFHVDFNSQNYYLKIGWNFANGHSMGNVYTTYAPYYNDGGLIGVFIYVTFTAIISQLIYEKALIGRKKDSKAINMYVVLYAYIVGTIFMSFFSNMIIPKILSYYTIKLFIIMYVIKFFVERIHVRIKSSKYYKR